MTYVKIIGVDEASLSSTAQYLQSLDIFSELNAEELEALADHVQEVAYEAGGVICYQRDVADTFYIVRRGRLYAQRADAQGRVRDAHPYTEGDYFNDVWLFEPGTHPTTVRGSEAGRLLLIDHDEFVAFLNDYPDALEFLHLSEEAREAAKATTFAEAGKEHQKLGLIEDELVAYHERRSPYLLYFRLAWPTALYLIWAVVINVVAGFGTPVALIGSLVPLIILALALVIQGLDWANDYFVITNRHLIHREYDLRRFRTRVHKIPLDQVQSVEIEKPSLLANLLDLGTARITTASQSSVLMFDFIDDPRLVKQTINRLREHVQALDAGRELSTMRNALEEYFQTPAAVSPVSDEGVERQMPESSKPAPGLLTRLRRGLSARVIDGNTITYRKHFFVLFKRTWVQMVAGLALFAGLALVPMLEVALALLGLWLLDLGWFIWRLEDWRNDTFQVTDRYVIDIDRRPFGFGESRKQAELGNVQNVNSDRPGLLATIFNYGYVTVETAGATPDIVFERVVNPNLIQSDIFERREAFRRRQRIREGQRRRHEYAVLLDVYQQAMEEGRIPKRLPTYAEGDPDEAYGEPVEDGTRDG
ncbi:MAG: cyclic nucleotide-binding domain-containing protein [Candidatus Promineifilaceae bacterium]|nr:cyclic nucleotide-binding domain-containing protein [Candidatus Promineifilaceae bacterium]